MQGLQFKECFSGNNVLQTVTQQVHDSDNSAYLICYNTLSGMTG